MVPRIAAALAIAALATAGAFSKSETPALVAAPRAADPGTLALKTERVIIFKDGYGLFVKSASAVADAEGKVHTEQVPGAAVLGTFWAISEQRAIKSTIAGWYETVRPRTEEGSCLSTLELLRANAGKQVTFSLGSEELSGKLLDVLEAPAARSKIPAGAEGTYEIELGMRGGELVAIETPTKGRLVVPVAAVQRLAGKELTTHCVRAGEVATRTKRLTFDFGPDAAGKAVAFRIFYFTPGVRWIPSYRVGTGDHSKAQLELQAEILNEEEDFAGAAVDLVVGVPSFKFKSVVSPMSLEQTLRAALAQAMPHLMNSNLGMSNAYFGNRAGEQEEGTERSQANVMAFAADLGAESQQDMFVYPVKSLGLKKGARAMVPLWRNEVPQRHLYTVDFGAYTRTASPDGSPLKLAENKVWHQLELSDTMDLPWTTGAALLMQGAFPLGQDLLGYTSPGGTTTIPITIALNMRALQSEREIERKPGALTVDHREYALATKKGTLDLTNLHKGPATMRVTLATAGKVGRATHGGKIVINDLDRVNNTSTTTWELTLGAGETVSLGYDLTVYL